MAGELADLKAVVEEILRARNWHFIFAAIKGFRNGLIYGIKIRGPHAFLMTFLFGDGTLLQKFIRIFQLTRTHAQNLSLFVFSYKLITGALEKIQNSRYQWHSFAAAFVMGYFVFGENNGVNMQINLYLMSRILLGLARLAVDKGYISQPKRPVFPWFAAVVMGILLWQFEHHKSVLQTSLQSSMTYLYHNSNYWSSIKDFILATYKMILYVLYRILQALFIWAQDLFLNFAIPRAISPCQVFSIIFRLKVSPLGLARESDFLYCRPRPASTSELLDENWTIYSLNERYMYLVLLPKPFHFYTALKAPFLHSSVFNDALKFARIPMSQFVKFTESNCCQNLNSRKIVYFSNLVRSGSTLLTQMLQVSDKVVTLAEPPGLSQICILQSQGVAPEQIDAMLKAYVSFLSYDLTDEQTLIIKARGDGARLIGNMARTLPNAKLLFLHRNISNCLQSSLRAFKATRISDQLTRLEGTAVFKFLAAWLFGMYSTERPILDQCMSRGPETAFCLLQIQMSFYDHFKKMYPIVEVRYEDLMANPGAEMERIFGACGIGTDRLEEALKCLENDSQKDTPLSKEQLQTFDIGQLDMNKEKIDFMTQIIERNVQLYTY